MSRLQEELDWAIARAVEMADDPPPADLAPAMDVVETGEAVILLAEVPGLAAADLEVVAMGNRVAIRGRRRAVAGGGGPVRFHCMERGRGDFERQIELAGSLDTHRARARLAQGLLRVEIPKIDDRRSRPRRIEIEGPES